MKIDGHTRFARVLFLLLVIALWGSARVDTQAPGTTQTTTKVDLNQIKDATLKTLLKGMEYNYDGVRSADGTFRNTVTINPASEAPYPGGVQSIRWTFSDNAFREETEQIEGGPKGAPVLQVIAFDGTTGYVYIPEHSYGAVIPTDLLENSIVSSNVAACLKLAYRFNINPHEKPPWQPIVEYAGIVRGRETLNGVDCYRVESPLDRKGHRHTWWIAPDRGYCIKRHQLIIPGEGPIEYRRIVEETLEFTQKGQFWLPSTIRQVFLTKRHGEAEVWDAKWELKAVELEINPRVDRRIFFMAFPKTVVRPQPGAERQFEATPPTAPD